MDDYAKMQQLTQELKKLAKDLNVPIIGAQQLQFAPNPHQTRMPQPDVLVVDGSYLLSLPTFFNKKREP